MKIPNSAHSTYRNPGGMAALLLGVGMALGGMADRVSADVPSIMQYSGVLQNNTGQPVASGDYRIALRIYDQTGTAQWGALYSVHVDDNGCFGVLLGAPGGVALPNTPVGATLLTALAGAPRTIGLTVMSDETGHPLGAPREMTPRQSLLSVPYAIAAQTAQSTPMLSAVSGVMPINTANLTLHGSMQCMGTPYIIVTNECDWLGNNCKGSGTAATDGFLIIPYESTADFGTILIDNSAIFSFSNACCGSSTTPRNQGWMVLPMQAGTSWEVQGHPAWKQVWWVPLSQAGTQPAVTNVPPLMDYQGRLTSSTNTAASGGDYLTRLRIYDQSGRTIWGSSNMVHVRADGTFNVQMGNGVGFWDPISQTSDLLGAFQGSQRNLGLAPMTDQNGVAITNVADLLPLQPLLSAPYALQAATAVSAGSLSNPAGPVILNGTIQLGESSVGAAQWLGAINSSAYPPNAWNQAPCDGFILIPYSDTSHSGFFELGEGSEGQDLILSWNYGIYNDGYAGCFMFPIPAGLWWIVNGATAGNVVYWIPWSR